MVELWLGLAVLLGPPVGEGPAEGPATAEELEASAESGGDPEADELAAIVDAAATAAQDRAVPVEPCLPSFEDRHCAHWPYREAPTNDAQSPRPQ